MIAGTIALIAVLLGFGASTGTSVLPKEVQKRLEQVITEPARAERAVAEWKGLQKEMEGFTRELKGLRTRVYAADDARSAGVAELEPIIAGFEPTRRAAQEKAIDHLLAIRHAMTREEWDALFSDTAGAHKK